MSAIVRVAIPVPLAQSFDYLPPATHAATEIAPGTRVLVPFAGRERVGIALGMAPASSLSRDRLKRIAAVLDEVPLVCGELLDTLLWLSRYYHHPLGEVLDAALPVSLRSARAVPPSGAPALMLVVGASSSVRAGSVSAALLALLANGPMTFEHLDASLPAWRSAASHLRRRRVLTSTRVHCGELPRVRIAPPPLTHEQQAAIADIGAHLGSFAQFLLEGITGSGKTEVYLALAEQALASNRQVLLLVPEIGLTPQLLRRVRERLAAPVHVLHSGLPDGERTRAWLAAARGEACVVLGTRSAVFVPLPRAGLIVVDEEHDGSYKQQDGLRYSARDTALVRGKALNVPVLLGSATPSLETIANVETGRYRRLHLSSRPAAARAPSFHCVDLRGKPLRDGLAPELIQAIRACVGRGEQALLFRNRRGYAPVLACHTCGWHADCARCDKPLTWHRGAERLRCHHCGAEQGMVKLCPSCGNTALAPLGVGTERLEQTLTALFPGVPVIRVDHETTRRKGALEDLLGRLQADQAGILVGTQMLAKGHDLPNLTLAALVGVDEGLFSVDFRASERLAQLIVQVAGRAGRARKPGSVWLQTHHPDHPLLRDVLQRGYMQVAHALLAERQAASLPPFAHLALLRAEAKAWPIVAAFLEHAVTLTPGDTQVNVLGPLPAPMPRRAGLFRGQLLLSAAKRGDLHSTLQDLLPPLRSSPQARRVRWSLDVDPQDLY